MPKLKLENRKKLTEDYNDIKDTLAEIRTAYTKNPSKENGKLLDETVKLAERTKTQLDNLQEYEEEQKEDQSKIDEKGENRSMVETLTDKQFENISMRAANKVFRKGTEKALRSKEYKDYVEAAEKRGIPVSDNITDPNTDGNGGAAIPNNIVNTIIEKAEYISPVVESSGNVTPVNGTISFMRENNLGEGAFLGEFENVPLDTVNNDKITLHQKRLGVGMKLSQNLINDVGVDMVGYSSERLGKALGRLLERNILIGKHSDTHFESVEEKAENVVSIPNSKLSYDDLIGMYTKLHTQYNTDDAMFIMSPSMFDKVAKLKDDDNKHLILYNVVSGDVGFKFMNRKVFVSNALEGSETPIIFGNFAEGYKMMTKKGFTLSHVADDTQQVMSGSHLLVLQGYVDGGVVNPACFVVANTKGQTTVSNTNDATGIAEPKK